MSKERRKHPRKPVRLHVEYNLEGGKKSADYMADVSQGGLFIKTEESAPRHGDRLHVTFSWMSGGPQVQATCEVTRVSPGGVGVAFVKMDPDSALLLNNFLAV
jgi:hypothetical protein